MSSRFRAAISAWITEEVTVLREHRRDNMRSLSTPERRALGCTEARMMAAYLSVGQ